MKIWALLSWWDEDPGWLEEMVVSVAALVDGVVAVDGPYPLLSSPNVQSPREQYIALGKACAERGLVLHAHTPGPLTEVDKRSYMFRAALDVAEPMRDWFLIMDGDMYADGLDSERVRRELAETHRHAAEVTFHNLDPVQDGNPKDRAFRSMFRAIPGLTVDGLHSFYTVPDFDGNRLYMWQPIGRHEPVPALDLTRYVHLYHRPHLRPAARKAARANYYDRRATANIEQVPDYVQE